MKKDYKIVSILMALILCLQFSCFTFVSANKIYPADIPYKPPKQSREELYQDIFMIPYYSTWICGIFVP